MGGVATSGRGSDPADVSARITVSDSTLRSGVLSTGAPAVVSVSSALRLHAASAHARTRPSTCPTRVGDLVSRVMRHPCDFTAGRPGRIFPSLRPFT
jgi:hypothetical protein